MSDQEAVCRGGRPERAPARRLAAPERLITTAVVLTAVVLLSAWGGAAVAPAAANRTSPLTIRAVRYGPETHQLLDLYLPRRAVRGRRVPIIVYLHSGGWIGGSRASLPDVASAQVPRGYALASVDYQLAAPGGPGSFPAAVFDVKRAIRFLKVDAARWGLDPARVIIMGSSAGGHLATLSGASAGALEPDLSGSLARVDSRVVAIIDIVGITDLTSFSTTAHPWAAPLTAAFLGCPIRMGRAACPPGLLRRASVAPYITALSPPIFMAYGGADNLVVASTQGAPIARAWVRAHHGDRGAAVYDVVAGAGHNIGSGQIDRAELEHFIDHAAGRS